MSVIYQTTITRIGQSAKEALGEQMLITFREGAPADIEEFCFIHCHGELTGALQPGARCGGPTLLSGHGGRQRSRAKPA